MGTNFYLGTQSKEARDQYFGWNYELTDTPTWLYQQHIAKTSMGWLPSFEESHSIHSVADIKKLYDTGKFIIYDEYGTYYNWEEFDERVLKFNGGVLGAVPREKIEQDPNWQFYDKDMPDYRPISHLEYAHGQYASEYFKDADGYEFTRRWFR
ncbi:MAG: hypothetical protein UH850_14915 [Paludibacteraceae bacterium]|nr:hypothetical protein [Paludibacteraceae bacterium]